MVIDARLDQAVVFLGNVISQFFTFPFPGTNIPVGVVFGGCGLVTIIVAILKKQIYG